MQVMRNELLKKGNLDLLEKNSLLEQEIQNERSIMQNERTLMQNERNKLENEKAIFLKLKSRTYKERFIDFFRRKLKINRD